MAKKGLGRGLEHLFEQNNSIEEDNSANIVKINLKEIKPNPYQPRKIFDESALKELADSIKINGVFQPILVRKNIIGYEIISGERRYRASKIAGMNNIPAIVYDYDEQKMMEIALVENIQREDLNIVEEAKSYQMLQEKLEYTQEKLAKVIGKSRSHIANVLRILKLNEEMQKALETEQISLGHAKILVGLDKEKNELQKETFDKIIKNNLNVRETEKYLKEQSAEPKKEKSTKKTEKISTKNSKTHYDQLENILREKLETKVQISGEKSGQIKIDYTSRNDLERLLEVLKIL